MGSSLQSQAYQAIRRQTIYADLGPGRKISEKALEEHLSIGRTPIREMLIQLCQQELVYTVPQGGTCVSRIDLYFTKNVRSVRERLEQQIVIEYYSKLGHQIQIMLETILKKQEKAVQAKDERAFFCADDLFHETCFEIADRKEVWNWLDDYSTHLKRFRQSGMTIQGLPQETIMEQHEGLFRALVDKKPEETRSQTGLHLRMMLKK